MRDVRSPVATVVVFVVPAVAPSGWPRGPWRTTQPTCRRRCGGRIREFR